MILRDYSLVFSLNKVGVYSVVMILVMLSFLSH